VEIPEAPNGGTLYRILFFSGFLLFLTTFVINTGAEMIRQRLRRKFGNY
jgi:phosphate transport system permease protein